MIQPNCNVHTVQHALWLIGQIYMMIMLATVLYIVTQPWNPLHYYLRSKKNDLGASVFYHSVVYNHQAKCCFLSPLSLLWVLGYTKTWCVLSLSLSANSRKTRGLKGLSKSHLFCLSVWHLNVPVYCHLLRPAGYTFQDTRLTLWRGDGVWSIITWSWYHGDFDAVQYNKQQDFSQKRTD